MGLDIHDSKDIRCAILAVEEASARTALMANYSDVELIAYRRGCQDSLTALGLAFGIVGLPFDLPTPRPALAQTQRRVLERR